MNRSHRSASRLALCVAAFCGGVVLMVLVTGTGMRLRSPRWLLDCAVASVLLFTAFCMKALRGRPDDAGKDLTPPPARHTTWFACIGYPVLWSAWIGYPVLVLVALLAADAVRTSLEDIVGLRRDEARAYFEGGNALAGAGKYEQVCEQYAKAVEIHPRLAEAYGNWGIALRRLGRHADACQKFAKVVVINPRDARAYSNWGDGLANTGRYAEACEKCAKAVEINPRYAAAYSNWGLALAAMGKLAEACGKFAKAVELDPGFGKAYLGWGAALAFMGKRTEAEEKWRKAVELNPELKPQIEQMRKQLLGKE